ncbi:e3 ubiquitin-protein ligase synoviolin [Fusarium flagelliforme]|uniref:RING-type E3 ubiquitin transferase n=2 Tax=Fusarium flagelliforme TaxID=2675880 RepID=A0A395N2E6_9HYPO|nr:e3 ubiquitin-protein ligase synoviolin [Fusarium flagelliforme]
MRLGWYAGASTALAGSVVLSAFYQRANFYSAMVYLAQSNFCLLVLVNFALLFYSSFVYSLIRLCYGPLRAVEVEQLTERAWFAITETCLAMTIFRDEIGAWFLVMFAALITGKVWGWIGDGRVEVLEQQPPANPRLFHLRLSVSLTLSFIYDIYILRYTINTVIQQARPNMMVMFLFEFAVLATSSWRTAARYALSLIEHNIQEQQKRKRLAERRQEVREEREAIERQREAAAAAGEEVSNDPLPNEDDIDEMDIEVPGWSSKGEFVLWLDLATDLVKLGIYIVFFFMLLTFYGLPIHIMRDLFMTARDFIKRLGALLRYRKAIQEMNRYPDATLEELAREDTCIICREEMRPWDPENNPGAMDRIRPKKLPCGHILHLGCLKSWLERQQVCPTCRSPVSLNENARAGQNRAAGLRIEIRGGAAAQQAPANPGIAPAQGQQNGGAQPEQRPAPPRVFNFGPLRVGFGANGQQARELAQQFGMPQAAVNQQGLAPPTQGVGTPPVAGQTAPATPLPTGDNLQTAAQLLSQADQMIQREVQSAMMAYQEVQTLQLLQAELQRIRQRQNAPEPAFNTQAQPIPPPMYPLTQPLMPQPYPMMPVPMQQLHMPSGFPQFSGLPPRIPSPLMARHGAAPNAVPIPSGSAELPEGVVIPPGWSLMPLQRLDGSQTSTQPSPQVGPQATMVDNITMPQPTSAARQPSPIGSRNQEAEPAESTSAPPSAPPQFPTQFTRAVDPPQVVAPSPRMPNWGGSAQLFGNNTRPNQTESESRNGLQAEPSSSQTTHAEAISQSSPAAEHTPEGSSVSHSEDDEEPASSSSKGKAKAVTVEDVDDDEDKDKPKED